MTPVQVPGTPRSSAYLSALTQEIEKKLHWTEKKHDAPKGLLISKFLASDELVQARASPSQRPKLLQDLFADIALEVDDRARDIILAQEEDVISPAEDGISGPLCFYDVLADYYVLVPESGKPILDLLVQLWSQSFASNIFTLLFHKWLFEVQLDNSEVLLRYSSALVQGLTSKRMLGVFNPSFMHGTKNDHEH